MWIGVLEKERTSGDRGATQEARRNERVKIHFLIVCVVSVSTYNNTGSFSKNPGYRYARTTGLGG